MISVKNLKDTAMLPGYIRLAAEINFGWWRKEKLWFDLPQDCDLPMINPGDVWLMALLPLAFKLGKELRIYAPVDPTLLQNAEALQRTWAEWFPPSRPIKIITETSGGHRQTDGSRTGCFFSGGVDSFFSVLHFDAIAGQKVDDLIYVWGYDIPLANRAAFDGKMAATKRIATGLGKTVTPIITNLRQTKSKKIPWGLQLHGPALAAAGLLLGPRYKTILVSSSQAPGDLQPWGTHQLTMGLMSSSRTQFVYYGGEFDRFQKTEFIAGVPVALENLHVCWVDQTEKNCGRCEKCYRTLLSLELVGKRLLAISFPQEDFSLAKVKDIKLANELAALFYMEIAKAARGKNRPDVLAAVEACLEANRNRK